MVIKERINSFLTFSNSMIDEHQRKPSMQSIKKLLTMNVKFLFKENSPASSYINLVKKV